MAKYDTKEILVVEDIMDSIVKHSIELQRVSNSIGGEIGREYKILAKELDSILADYDFSRNLPVKKRKNMLASVLTRGRKAIDKSNVAMAGLVKNRLIEVGTLETDFNVGSLNKAVTGKGNVAFVTNKVGTKKISSIADNLILQGAPQKELWSRQSKNLQNKFRDIIRDGWVNQQDIPTIAQRIRGTAANNYKDGIMKVSKHQANSIARTSISSVSNQVREETYLANQDVIEGVQFLAVLDGNTTHICRAYSGDKWRMDEGGWRNIEGGHEYRSPPLHFNCRSTMIPLMKPPSRLAASKVKMVPKEKQKTLGRLIGPKVCHSPCKYQDADLWLKDQPIAYQKDVMGKSFDVWLAGGISFKRMVTQKGRNRTLGELKKIYEQQSVIPAQISALKTADTFKANAGASKKLKEELSKYEKGKFLNVEEKLMTGQSLSRAESDKFGLVLKNADPDELEFGSDYFPETFGDFLGNKSKRLAFYNHYAKRSERISKLRKGDLEKRKTGRISDIDAQVLQHMKDKIAADTKISASNKKILLEMYDEAYRIVGTQRSIPMMESLLTLARSNKLKDVVKGDSFVGYLNNAAGNAVNSYFSQVKNLEIRMTVSTEKVARYNTLSENSKKLNYTDINSNSKTTLAEANEVRKKITKIGKRSLRDFEGDLNHLSVDLELDLEDNMGLYFRFLQKEARMDDKEIKSWMKRITPRNGMTDSEKLHLARVDFIKARTNPGDKVLLSDAILDNPLFKEWKDNAWSGRGFPPSIRKEVGQVFGDVEIYQGAKYYLSNRSVLPSKFKNLDDLILKGKAPKSVFKKKVSPLYDMDGKSRDKLRKARESAEDTQINKEGRFAKAIRKEEKKTLSEKAEEARELAAAEWEDLADAEYVGKVNSIIERMIGENFSTGSKFFREASALSGENTVRLSQLVNTQVMFSAQKGATYIDTVKSIGEKYFYTRRGIMNADEDDSILIGNFLVEAMVEAKLVKRVKTLQRVQKPGQAPKDVLTWRLEIIDEDWERAVLANKKNYNIDGLPSVGEVPLIDENGIYESGQSVIRGLDREWVAKQVKKRSSKPWVDNLNIEASTGIKVNGYVYDVMTELEKRGKSIIPTKPSSTKEVVAMSKYDSYTRARKASRALRDDVFYNRMANDKFGRTYADTISLHWQGDDINRGLMVFSKGKKLGKGMPDFKRYFLGLAGFDKVPKKSLYKLFDKIPDKVILDTAKNPLKHDWWYTPNDWFEKGIFKDLKGIDPRDIKEIKKLASAANPSDEGAFQFLALIKERAEMIKWTQSGKKLEDYVTHVPSQIDGSTNVLQHMGAIGRDKNIAKAANMTKQRTVSDAYIQVREALDEIGSRMDPNDPLRKYIDIPGLTHSKRRKSVKKGLMTYQYNAGARTLGEGYFEALEGVQVKGKFIFREATSAEKTAVGRMIMQAAEGEFSQASKMRLLLNDLADAHEISKRGSIEVKTKIGFPFNQSYKETAVRQIELNTSFGKIKLDVRVELDDIDYGQMHRAFAPNIIHNMDSMHKTMVANKLKNDYGITDFSMIHDSFGTNFADMALMERVTKEVFLEMYEGKNFMRFLYDNFKKQGIGMKRFIRDEKGKKVKDGKGGFLTEDIPLSEVEDFGDFNFKDFEKLEYFFH